ncbi:hypothetical protein CLF_100769 [Clonorchis sinensis]|uniref:Uncharacterized protein n=1 Tax=Clonorchis sinensis TaxID=79923 RepID=G7Y473_CLOSI|nr:hypothetical protein CLF_100769 [Clonorchis sinensis]
MEQLRAHSAKARECWFVITAADTQVDSRTHSSPAHQSALRDSSWSSQVDTSGAATTEKPIPCKIGQKFGTFTDLASFRALTGRKSGSNSQSWPSIVRMTVVDGASRRRQNFQKVVGAHAICIYEALCKLTLSFMSTITRLTCDPADRFSYLVHHCEVETAQANRRCIVLEPEEGYAEALRIRERRFALRQANKTFIIPYGDEAVRLADRSFYVDDCLISLPTKRAVKTTATQFKEAVESGAFKPTGFFSNVEEAMCDVPGAISNTKLLQQDCQPDYESPEFFHQVRKHSAVSDYRHCSIRYAYVRGELFVDIASSFLWTDCPIVLRMVPKRITRHETFLANRLASILDYSEPED